jgi:putative ABC transport system ATP-binding protein
MSENGASVTVRGLAKSYEGGRIEALRGIDIEIASGDFIAIMGPSGCGKSTLLNILGGLDVPDEGEVTVGGTTITEETDLTEYRAKKVGFVFQLHNLIPVLTATENVQVPMLSPGGPPKEEREGRARKLIESVGLLHRADARPPELSGGERQRVAVARALANEPGVILADEPTGSMDQGSGRRILDVLAALQETSGTTLILVTHDESVASRAARTIRMLDGRTVD